MSSTTLEHQVQQFIENENKRRPALMKEQIRRFFDQFRFEDGTIVDFKKDESTGYYKLNYNSKEFIFSLCDLSKLSFRDGSVRYDRDLTSYMTLALSPRQGAESFEFISSLRNLVKYLKRNE